MENSIKLVYLKTAIEAMKSNDITTLTQQFAMFTLYRENPRLDFIILLQPALHPLTLSGK